MGIGELISGRMSLEDWTARRQAYVDDVRAGRIASPESSNVTITDVRYPGMKLSGADIGTYMAMSQEEYDKARLFPWEVDAVTRREDEARKQEELRRNMLSQRNVLGASGTANVNTQTLG